MITTTLARCVRTVTAGGNLAKDDILSSLRLLTFLGHSWLRHCGMVPLFLARYLQELHVLHSFLLSHLFWIPWNWLCCFVFKISFCWRWERHYHFPSIVEKDGCRYSKSRPILFDLVLLWNSGSFETDSSNVEQPQWSEVLYWKGWVIHTYMAISSCW